MERIRVIAILMAFSAAFLTMGLSFASDYAFGTKVAPQDIDVGKPLKNVREGTIISFWDIGSDRGAYDDEDIVYLDMPPRGTANANDVRITSFIDHQAGSKVKPTDEDMNVPLEPMPAEIRFLNLYGSQSYDLNDPVYVHQSNSLHLGELTYVDTNKPKRTTATTTKATIAIATNANAQEYTASPEGYIPNSHGYASHPQEYATVMSTYTSDGFSERLAYSGSCSGLPPGTVCLTYSDNYKLMVSDYRIDCCPYPAGLSNGRQVEVIRCNSADYYHILGTSLVKITPKQKTLFIQSAPSQSVLSSPATAIQDKQELAGPNKVQTSQNPYSQEPYQEESSPIDTDDINRIIDAINDISANSDSTRTNDVRLVQIGQFAAGMKVQDFDPDQNRLVALPVLVSFPRDLNDYAGIRFYDVNGNRLCDFPDDIYMDISFRGSNPFGTVSVNDIRLSGPAV